MIVVALGAFLAGAVVTALVVFARQCRREHATVEFKLGVSEARLNRTRRKLLDEVHNLHKWGFADTPSQREDRVETIHGLIRDLVARGGDPVDVLDSRDHHRVADALPEMYERVRNGNATGWSTQRRAAT